MDKREASPLIAASALAVGIKSPHSQQSCPAKDVECHNCKMKGHYSSQCFSMAIAEVNEADTTLYNTSYLTAIIDMLSGTSWSTTVAVNRTNPFFKLDTGAEVNVVLEKALKSLGVKELQSSSKRLQAR